MARADLLLDLVKGGARGDQELFRKALAALVTEERAKHHDILADRLTAYLANNGGAPALASVPRRTGAGPSPLREGIGERQLQGLVLPSEVERAARELIEEQSRVELLQAYNLEPRHRVLLIGPPGNGKTTLAEAFATELAVPYMVVRYEAVIASYLGETAVRLARLFDEVRTRRCVLFFDELDVVGKERGDIHETGEIKRVVSSLLLQIDELPSTVVVVAASNHPELLDRAVWRRFQLRLRLPNPSQAAAEEWFRRFEEQMGVRLGYAPSTLAKRLKGLSFSELEQFSLDALRQRVLRLPEDDMATIVRERLEQWRRRAGVPMAHETP
jgi:SpoVK/Ycf46/Vps4 family AAA+-type ATPase